MTSSFLDKRPNILCLRHRYPFYQVILFFKHNVSLRNQQEEQLVVCCCIFNIFFCCFWYFLNLKALQLNLNPFLQNELKTSSKTRMCNSFYKSRIPPFNIQSFGSDFLLFKIQKIFKTDGLFSHPFQNGLVLVD